MCPRNLNAFGQRATRRGERTVAILHPGRAARKLLVATAGAGIATAGVLATPPTNDQLAIVRLLSHQDAAVLRVGERLSVSGARICIAPARSAGVAIQQLSQYGADYRSAAHSVLGIAERPTIALVAAGGAAEVAGVRQGDVIAAIDGHVFVSSAPRGNAGDFKGIAASHDIIDAALSDGRAQLSLIRGGQPLTLVIVPRIACQARFEVRAGRRNNASADGTYVQISSDLVDQARGDGELAAILAHELAHNILEHPQQLRAKGNRPKVRATEVEADRLSVYLLDAAGYAPADAIAFWSHWGRANDLGIFSDRTHPGWKKRINAIKAETMAIAALKAAGKPVRLPADLQRRR